MRLLLVLLCFSSFAFGGDVRDYGADGSDDLDDTAAFAAALKRGGRVTVPDGTYKISSTLVIALNNTSIHGESDVGTTIDFTGSGVGIQIEALYRTAITNLRLRNVGTGTIGIEITGDIEIDGKRHIAWRHALEHLTIQGFSSSGLHMDHVESVYCQDVFSYRNGIGFHLTGKYGNSVTNYFLQCRAMESAREGWWVDSQICFASVNCESLNNAGVQFFVKYCYASSIENLDIEDTTKTKTQTGLKFQGANSRITAMSYGLRTGIELQNTVGCEVGPSRFSQTTTAIKLGPNNKSLSVFDGLRTPPILEP